MQLLGLASTAAGTGTAVAGTAAQNAAAAAGTSVGTTGAATQGLLSGIDQGVQKALAKAPPQPLSDKLVGGLKNYMGAAVNELFPSLNQELVDTKTGEPLTGARKYVAKGLSLVRDLNEFQQLSPIEKTVTRADTLSGGNLTKTVQEDIIGGLNGSPVRNFPDGTPITARSLFTPEGAALFRDRFNAAKKRSEREKEKLARAAGRTQ